VVRRVIHAYSITGTTQSTTFTQDTVSGFWLIAQANLDQLTTTTTLNSTAVDALMNSIRVLAHGIYGAPMAEIPSAVQSITNRPAWTQGMADWKGKLTMMPEDVIFFASQLQNDASAVMTLAQMHGFSRVLIEKP